MSGFTLEQWLLIGAIASLGLLGLLWAVSVQIEQHTGLTDLKYQVKVLRRDYTRRLAELHSDEDLDAVVEAAVAEAMAGESEAGVEPIDVAAEVAEPANPVGDVEEVEPAQAA